LQSGGERTNGGSHTEDSNQKQGKAEDEKEGLKEGEGVFILLP